MFALDGSGFCKAKEKARRKDVEIMTGLQHTTARATTGGGFDTVFLLPSFCFLVLKIPFVLIE